MDLKEAGLTDNEQKVYTSLVDLGSSLAGKISRKTGLHRRTVYDVTETLIQKGLISYIIENNRRVFTAVNPQRILDVIDEKKNMLTPLVESLKQKFNTSKKKEQTNFYKGKNGMKMVFESQLEYPEILILGATRDAYNAMPYYFKWFNERRKEKRVKIRVITSDKSISPKILAETRYLAEKYSSHMVINIYGINVAMILWGKNPFALVVQQEEFASGYKKYFEILWKIARK
ncbi:MAG: helix-turn-helix domain-containing protein [Nanoarchaeota archaeon]